MQKLPTEICKQEKSVRVSSKNFEIWDTIIAICEKFTRFTRLEGMCTDHGDGFLKINKREISCFRSIRASQNIVRHLCLSYRHFPANNLTFDDKQYARQYFFTRYNDESMNQYNI